MEKKQKKTIETITKGKKKKRKRSLQIRLHSLDTARIHHTHTRGGEKRGYVKCVCV